ncbi:MAG: hypothetical protein EB119_09650, partial [Synechococcaceae bacterium WBB_34_004]|nr:hypothetical protein [Synechococcaceae bacterium WBB_34_004]
QLSDEKVTDQQPEKVSEIKKLIEQYAEKYFKKAAIMSEYAGGGGTNAVQYANGGTMNGDLNVNGNYLSGGINLLDIFSGGGGGDPAVNAVVYANSGNWDSNYTTTNANSANWQTGYNNALYTINGTANQIVATPAGSNTGNNSVTLSLPTNLIVPNNLTVQGNLTALGSSTFKNTIFTTTSALSVYNTGPGPALFVYQAAGPYDVASFYDGDGIEVLHVGNAQPGGRGFVGINESFPGAELTVNGAISSNGYITVSGGNSNQWNSNYTTTNTNSAAWSNWSTVSATYALGSQYVKLSGDTMTGPLSTTVLSASDVYIQGTTRITSRNTTNIFIGDATTGNNNATGNHNFVFGVSAGNALTTGSNNVFMGNCAGRINTTGNFNNFLGLCAGLCNMTGSVNNFFGYRAGAYNTTGNSNNFLGRYAGYKNTTGGNNNFLGNEAGFCNTTGCYNNFLGCRAGFSNTTGYENNFLGFRAGFSNTTGNSNNFFGRDVGSNNITGYSNNFLGSFTGYYNSTGSNNNFLG